MGDKISKKNIPEPIKPPRTTQSPNEFDGNTISACFSNVLGKFTIKQANIMGSFAEVLTNNQTKNINKISDEIGKKLETFNNSLTTYNKTKSSTGVATISINPNNIKATVADTISANPRSTSRPMPV